MRLLLDSRVLLWWREGGERLNEISRAEIASTENDVYFSTATPWEFSIKENAGRLTMDWDRFDALVGKNGFLPLSIEMRHGIAAGQLPRHHVDPFDRMLIAQAMLENLTVVTHDQAFAAYDVTVLWA